MTSLILQLLPVLPEPLRVRLFYRFLNGNQSAFPDRFRDAPLKYAPARMRDLLPGDVISGSIAALGFYELGLTREFARLAQQHERLLDVGANLGYFSLLWASSRPQNRVVAVEASPRNQEIFRSNVEHNDLAERVELMPVAAGDRAGSIRFSVGPEEQTGWGMIAKEGETENTIEVPMVRLDEALGGYEPEVVKIDVEGADALVIRGLEGLLRRKVIQHLFFEVNEANMYELGVKTDDITGFLDGLDYQCEEHPDFGWHASPR